jgi:hypothetical protein
VTGAIALAIVLVVAVAGISMAVESQRNMQSPGPRPASRLPPRPTRTRAPRSEREKPWERRSPPPPREQPPPPTEPESKAPPLLQSGVAAEAKVISVVDERTIGPVTRSRLALEIDPGDGPSFEVTVRWAFPTPSARARVKVGGTLPVRYDKDDHTRVVVDLPPE